MKRVSLLLLSLFALTYVSSQTINETSQGVKFQTETLNVHVEFYDASTVRVMKWPLYRDFSNESLSVVAKPEQVKVVTRRNNDVIKLRSNKIEVAVNIKNGQVSFATQKGESLLTEQADGASFVEFNDAGTETFKVKQAFVLDPEETVYGLGILQNGKMSQRNQHKHLVQGNVEDVVTFIQSIKGYGIFWDNYSPTNFVDTPEETSFESDVGDCMDYYFMYGENADGVIAGMRYLTGEVPMFPLWTYGYWQSRERYKSQDELLEVVKKHRELGVPLDGIIQDWQYWGNNYLWNAMEFLNPEFYNPQEMVDKVHEQNAHMIISIWSSFGPMTKPYKDLNEKGLLFNFKTWPESGLDTWPPNPEYPSGVRVYDAYSPVARDVYWKHLTRLYDLGIDGFWMDSTEPDHLNWKPEDYDTQTYLGSFRKVRNAYPLMTVGGVYDNQRATSSDKRVFTLTRSFFAGQQRYGANVWSGDVPSSWDALRNQVPAGLNFTLTGNPNYNTDIGGFFAGAYNKSWNDGTAAKNPMFQELYVRWMQYGAFSPMMRSHGTDMKREIYYFGEKGEPIYDAIEKSIHLRYSLLPYIYSTSWEVTDKNGSFLRALMMDFPKDKNVWDMGHQFMFGRSLLVAPILKSQYTPEKLVEVNESDGWNRDGAVDKSGSLLVDFTAKKKTKVYLPAGTVWYDYYDNKKHNGGQEIEYESTIDRVPLFVKAGSIIPIGPKVQYATEKAWDNLELKVYAGANGTFILYEDEFDNYNYEKGAYSEIPIHWNDKTKRLTIEKRKGNFPGMLNDRSFTVVLQDGTSKTINYSGKKVVISFR